MNAKQAIQEPRNKYQPQLVKVESKKPNRSLWRKVVRAVLDFFRESASYDLDYAEWKHIEFRKERHIEPPAYLGRWR